MALPLLVWVGAGLLLAKAGGGAGAPVSAGTSTQLTDINGSPQLFAQSLFSIISRIWPSLSVNARLLIVAQAAFESGWGSTGQHRGETNNVWDLTAGSTWAGPIVQGTSPDGGVLQEWRAYPDLETAVADFPIFLGQFDSAALAELYGAADPSTYAADLGAAGYYDTRLFPVAQYAGNLVSMVQTVRSYVGVG